MTLEFSVEMADGREVLIEVSATVWTESDYGADADGNRGVSRTFVDDYEYEIPDRDTDGYLFDSVEKEEIEKKLLEQLDDADWEDV